MKSVSEMTGKFLGEPNTNAITAIATNASVVCIIFASFILHFWPFFHFYTYYFGIAIEVDFK